MLTWFVGNTIEEITPRGIYRRPPTSIFSGGRRGRFVAPEVGNDVWVGAIDVTPAEAAQLVSNGAVLFNRLSDVVPVAARTKLLALGVPAAIVNGASSVRELLREAAQAPDDTFDRLEATVIEDRIRRP